MKSEESKQKKIALRGRLLKYLEQHGEGGRVPPERELSLALNVNRYLLRNCVRDLIQEGMMVRKPRRGTFLISRPDMQKRIGIVLENGETSPYFNNLSMFGGVIDALDEADCQVRLINFSRCEQFASLFRQYCLDGCVWLNPSEKEQKYIASLPADIRKKIVVASNDDPTLLQKRLGKQFSALDWENMSRTRAEYFIRRGHTRIAYLSVRTWTYNCFCSVLKEHGLPWNEDCLIDRVEDISGRLPLLIKKYGINAILCNGSFFHEMFRTLDNMPESQFDLSVENVSSIRFLQRQYPRVKVNFMFENAHCYRREIGNSAVKILLRALECGELQEPVLVAAALV